MKHLLTAATIFLLYIPIITAQTPKTRQLDLSLGYGLLARQDLVFSPFVHESASPLHLALTYQRSRHWEQAWSLGFAQFAAQHRTAFDYTLPTAPGELQHTAPHDFTFVDLGYKAGKRVAVRERSIWTLGGAVSADLDVMNYNHARISNFGYFMAFDLAAWGKWAYQPAPRHSVEAEVQLPILAWTARSPYLINDDKFIENTASHRSLKTLGKFIGDGRLTTLDDYHRATLILRYHFLVTGRWYIGAGYQGDWLRHDRPLPLRSARQQLMLNFSLHF